MTPTILDVVPSELAADTQVTIRVDGPVCAGEARLLRCNGAAMAVVSATDDDFRSFVADEPYRAQWIGWNRRQCPAVGETPRQALHRLISDGPGAGVLEDKED